MATQNLDMLKTQIHRPDNARTFFLLNKPCFPSHSFASFSFRPGPQLQKKYRNVRAGYVLNNAKAVAGGTRMSTSVKATVTVKLSDGGCFFNLVGLSHGPDDILDLAKRMGGDLRVRICYSWRLWEIGAVLVENEYKNEMYLKHIVLNGLPNDLIEFNCDSWGLFTFKVSHHLLHLSSLKHRIN
ncbi:hypothetical protein AAG906_040165 [Vitis piasezkii]